jgi:hypothetical protein
MKHVLCVFLLFALPAFATISQRQSPVSQWNSGSSTTCSNYLPGSGYVAGDLIVVWTYWTTSGTNNLTASVADTYGNGVGTVNPVYPSAVGPTVQPSASSPIAAQIFYAKNTKSGSGNDTITVSYSVNGTPTAATTSGCVFVEYQGADINYPLDSVSAGYSTSGNPTALLDSGTVAPANSNLLLFGGGTWDAGSLIPGGSFTAIQASGGSITEQEIVSGNNTLQRATAIPNPAPSGSGGNWVMQMAVFRDASWTVAGGWPPVRPAQVLDATQFPGTVNGDIGDKVNGAYASCPSTGCRIRIPPNPAGGCWNYSTQILFKTVGVVLEGDPYGATCIFFTPVLWDCDNARLANKFEPIWRGWDPRPCDLRFVYELPVQQF